MRRPGCGGASAIVFLGDRYSARSALWGRSGGEVPLRTLSPEGISRFASERPRSAFLMLCFRQSHGRRPPYRIAVRRRADSCNGPQQTTPERLGGHAREAHVRGPHNKHVHSGRTRSSYRRRKIRQRWSVPSQPRSPRRPSLKFLERRTKSTIAFMQIAPFPRIGSIVVCWPDSSLR